MANSGSFNTNAYGARYLTFEWTLESQSVPDNSSTIKWTLKGAGGSSTKYYMAGNFKVVIEGETVYESYPSIKLYNQVVASGTKTIYHNSDGNKSISASASAGIYYTQGSNCTGSGSWDLPKNPRQANLTSAPNFNDEQNPTICYSNPAGSAVSKVEACITLASNGNAYIANYRELDKTGASYTFNLTTAERQKIYEYSKETNDLKVMFWVSTNTDGKRYHSTIQRTVSIINASPTINPTVYDTDSKALEATGNENNFIAGYSDATFVINAQAYKGASIVSQHLTVGGKSNWNPTGTINDVESGTFNFYAVDSRGNVASTTIERTCYPYVPATCAITGTRLVADGTLTISFTGKLYDGTFGKTEGNDNKHFAYYQYKEQGGKWSGWISVSNLIKLGNYGTYTVDAPIEGLDYTKTYVVKAAIEDSFTWKQTDEKVVISRPVFDWGKDDFRFNCSTISGAVYSLGGIPEENFIPAYSDFNDYKKPGIYCVGQTTDMPTMTNAPDTSAGRLICVASLGDANNEGIWSYLIQRFIPYTSKGSWKRTASTGSTPDKWTWTDWVLELNSNDTDYIVAQGVSGNWRYRKWNSGLAECWGSKSTTGSMTVWYETSYGCMTRVDYPFTFEGVPFEQVTVHSSNGVWLYQEGYNTATQTGNYGVMRPASSPQNVTVKFDYYVTGLWK